jgi:two-component system sensor histidine kinase HydH
MCKQERDVFGDLNESGESNGGGQTSRSLETLSAALAHRLRNPLTVIKIIVQSAAENGDTGLINGRALGVLADEVRRLEQIVDMFLDYARPVQPQRQSCDLDQFLKQIVKQYASRAAQQAVQLDLQTPAEPVSCYLDPERFEQAITALLVNALEATPKGTTIQIRVFLASAEECPFEPPGSKPKRWARVDIVDAGAGVPAELREPVFAPFFSTKEMSVGLDLTICRQIIRQHEGEVTVDQHREGGAVFSVWLPAEPPTKSF